MCLPACGDETSISCCMHMPHLPGAPGRAALAGVLDGFLPVGFEDQKDQEDRLALLKMIGYKR